MLSRHPLQTEEEKEVYKRECARYKLIPIIIHAYYIRKNNTVKHKIYNCELKFCFKIVHNFREFHTCTHVYTLYNDQLSYPKDQQTFKFIHKYPRGQTCPIKWNVKASQPVDRLIPLPHSQIGTELMKFVRKHHL